VLLPLVDTLVGRYTANADAAQAARLQQHQFWFDLPLYVYCIFHIALVVWGAWLAAQLSGIAWLLMALSVGIVTGAQGITIAHELGHRRGAAHRFLSQMLLVWVSYGHFYIEHNRGHHVRVATAEDPATSRLGESYYRFWWRTVTGSFASAWTLELQRLARRNLSVWHPSNRFLQLLTYSAAIAGVLTVLFGPWALLFFIVQSTVAFSLLEAVNYVEHYGLTREKQANQRFERVRPVHSWNDAHAISNAYLFNLQRHSDHHANPSTPYPQLVHHAQAPQLPAGYATMVKLALLPPLWFKVMNPRVLAWQQARAQEREMPQNAQSMGVSTV
jgi:alkane 1-monooxygenase